LFTSPIALNQFTGFKCAISVGESMFYRKLTDKLADQYIPFIVLNLITPTPGNFIGITLSHPIKAIRTILKTMIPENIKKSG
jgi:hypothetical protein